MRETIIRFKEKIIKTINPSESSYPEDVGSEYLEVSGISEPTVSKNKVIVRSFVIEDFADIKSVLDALRDGYTIALVNVKPIREKDVIELKRVVAKLKKTCEAIEGDIAGFGEDWVVVTPSFAQIYRSSKIEEVPLS